MNPLARLSPAVYAALVGLAVADVAVPVYEQQAPPEARFFVLLSAPAILAASGRPGCRGWTCQLVLDVVTRFPTEALSADPADELAEQVLLRLAGVPLALPAGWQGMAGRLVAADQGEMPPPEQISRVVQRRLTLEWDVYCHIPAPALSVAEPVSPVRETAGFLAGLRAYFQRIF